MFFFLNPYVIHSVHTHGEPTPGLGLLPSLGVMDVHKTGEILLARGRCTYQLGSPSEELAAPWHEADSAAPARVGRHPASYYAPGQAGFSSEAKRVGSGILCGAFLSSLGSQVTFEGECGSKATP